MDRSVRRAFNRARSDRRQFAAVTTVTRWITRMCVALVTARRCKGSAMTTFPHLLGRDGVAPLYQGESGGGDGRDQQGGEDGVEPLGAADSGPLVQPASSQKLV